MFEPNHWRSCSIFIDPSINMNWSALHDETGACTFAPDAQCWPAPFAAAQSGDTAVMITIRQSRADETGRLYEIWQDAVRASHGFISADDMADIELMVKTEYLPGREFWVAADEDDRAVGFMSLEGPHVDSLFVTPDRHGQGVGRALLAHAYSLSRVLSVEVNEQNMEARRFYERMGFVQVGWTATDAGGRPYPLLMLHLADGSPLE
jgi:putative acetyltransferase